MFWKKTTKTTILNIFTHYHSWSRHIQAEIMCHTECRTVWAVVVVIGKSNYLCNQVPFTTKVVRSNPAYGEVYSIQHYVIKFVRDLQQVLIVSPPPIKLTPRNIVESGVKHHNPELYRTRKNKLIDIVHIQNEVRVLIFKVNYAKLFYINLAGSEYLC